MEPDSSLGSNRERGEMPTQRREELMTPEVAEIGKGSDGLEAGEASTELDRRLVTAETAAMDDAGSNGGDDGGDEIVMGLIWVSWNLI